LLSTDETKGFLVVDDELKRMIGDEGYTSMLSFHPSMTKMYQNFKKNKILLRKQM